MKLWIEKSLLVLGQNQRKNVEERNSIEVKKIDDI